LKLVFEVIKHIFLERNYQRRRFNKLNEQETGLILILPADISLQACEYADILDKFAM
jgi:hypothetical protein